MINPASDCFVGEDGGLVCYDRDCRRYYRLSKKEVTVDDLSKAELAGLVELLGGAVEACK
jgi:hypothetical protein